MKKYIIYLVLALGGLFYACEKKGDFSGSGYLRGRLVYTDSLTGNGTAVGLAGKSVKLAAEGSDTLNYKYSVVTDKDGYFSFTNLADMKYDLFFRDTLGTAMLLAFDSRKPATDAFLFRARHDGTRQNGIYVEVTDNQGNPLGNSSVCVFNNPLLAQTDTCAGSIFQLQTDAQGRAVKYGIPAGDYYTAAKFKINAVLYKGLVHDKVKVAGITTFKLNTSATEQPLKTGFDLQVVDENNQPLGSSQICVFNSKILSEEGSCAGSILQLTADANGKASAYGIAPNKYYFTVLAKYGELELIGKAEINVEKDAVATVVIHMLKKI